MQLSPYQIMIRTQILTTRDGETIQISRGELKLREIQHHHICSPLINPSIHPPTTAPLQQNQSPPTSSRNFALEDKVLNAINTLKANTQLLHTHSQTLSC
jgi:hypothetical protein